MHWLLGHGGGVGLVRVVGVVAISVAGLVVSVDNTALSVEEKLYIIALNNLKCRHRYRHFKLANTGKNVYIQIIHFTGCHQLGH